MAIHTISDYIATIMVLGMLLYVIIKLNKTFKLKEDLK